MFTTNVISFITIVSITVLFIATVLGTIVVLLKHTITAATTPQPPRPAHPWPAPHTHQPPPWPQPTHHPTPYQQPIPVIVHVTHTWHPTPTPPHTTPTQQPIVDLTNTATIH